MRKNLNRYIRIKVKDKAWMKPTFPFDGDPIAFSSTGESNNDTTRANEKSLFIRDKTCMSIHQPGNMLM